MNQVFMLNRLNNKPKVLIFGAVSDSINKINVLKNKYQIVGFLDNDISKQGTVIARRIIYSPKDLNKLSYDKIIIASSYHIEIKRQLVEESYVDPDKIQIYKKHPDTKAGSSNKYYILLNKRLIKIALSRGRLIAKLAIAFLKRIDVTYYTTELRTIRWLDQTIGNTLYQYSPSIVVPIYHPKLSKQDVCFSNIEVPAIKLGQYFSATIHCNTNSLLDHDNVAIWRSTTSINPHVEYTNSFLVHYGKTYAITRKVNTIDIPKGIAITGSSDINYYHWILEVLSKLSYVISDSSSYASYPILISENVKKIPAIHSFFSHLTLPNKVIYLKSINYYRVNELLTITPPNFVFGGYQLDKADCYYSPDSLKFLRKTGLSYLASKTQKFDANKRIFLARKNDIRSYNQSDVLNLLTNEGFKAVFFEDMLLEEQISCMHNAEVIAGPTGAAWTNLLFCKPGARALCWMAEETGSFSCFSHIAAEMKVDMQYITYTTGAENSRDLFYSIYHVDIDQIKKWIVDNLHTEN